MLMHIIVSKIDFHHMKSIQFLLQTEDKHYYMKSYKMVCPRISYGIGVKYCILCYIFNVIYSVMV